MPKYWGTQIFSLGSFPEVGQKQKIEKKKEERKKETRKYVFKMASYMLANALHVWRIQAA